MTEPMTTPSPEPDKPGVGEANARLIAAAPDLLEACRQMLDDGDLDIECYCADHVACNDSCAYCKMAAAIARAEGKYPMTEPMTNDQALEELRRLSAKRPEDSLGLVVSSEGRWVPIVAYAVKGLDRDYHFWEPLKKCSAPTVAEAVQKAKEVLDARV